MEIKGPSLAFQSTTNPATQPKIHMTEQLQPAKKEWNSLHSSFILDYSHAL
jgi:hypothetical protein